MKNKKWIKPVAVVLSAALIAQIFMFSMNTFGSNDTVNNVSAGESEDTRIATELSNMTGLTVEEILDMKTSGVSWNQVIEELESLNGADSSRGREERITLLSASGLDEADMKRLQEEGFEENEILEAKMLAERVYSQLKDIADSESTVNIKPEVDINTDHDQDDLEDYKQLLELFHVGDAVELMLQLEQEFGSFEAVLEEYILTLQIEVDLFMYLRDKVSYELEKEEKRLQHVEPLVKLLDIENKMLEKIQAENAVDRDEPIVGQFDSIGQAEEVGNHPLPDVPSPTAEELKPTNPTDAIMKEIEILNPNEPILE